MKILDIPLLINLTEQAKQNPRLRQNYNLHESLEASCHRLLNAMEPGSYIRPHRHSHPQKQEGFVALRGRLAVFIFDEQGGVQEIVRFGPRESVVGVDIPTGVWHTVVSLASGSVFYEVKAGPYLPVPLNDSAHWAPKAGSEEATNYLDNLVDMVTRQNQNLPPNIEKPQML
ncbi:MAG: WbuC family cupin fold metalloprotein [Chlorobium sp.]|nr:WbuC family cupin fold metalloprotein [Chlorobium sp.]